MIKIYRHGSVEGEDSIEPIINGLVEIVVAKEVEVITDYWLFFKDHKKCGYFGTPESFAQWQKEQVQ